MIDQHKKSLSWFTQRIGKNIFESSPSLSASTQYKIKDFTHAEQLNLLQDIENVVFSDEDLLAHLNNEPEQYIVAGIPKERLTPETLMQTITTSLIQTSANCGIIVEAIDSFPYFKVKYEQPDWYFAAVFYDDEFCLKPLTHFNPSQIISQKRATQLVEQLSILESLIDKLNTIIKIKLGKIIIKYE